MSEMGGPPRGYFEEGSSLCTKIALFISFVGFAISLARVLRYFLKVKGVKVYISSFDTMPATASSN